MRLVSSTLEVRNEQEMKFYSHIQRVTHPIANIKRMKNFHRNKSKMLISGSSTCNAILSLWKAKRERRITRQNNFSLAFCCLTHVHMNNFHMTFPAECDTLLSIIIVVIISIMASHFVSDKNNICVWEWFVMSARNSIKGGGGDFNEATN